MRLRRPEKKETMVECAVCRQTLPVSETVQVEFHYGEDSVCGPCLVTLIKTVQVEVRVPKGQEA